MTVTFPAWDNAAYHADTTHDSSSSLKLLAKSPLKYWATRIAKTMDKDEPDASLRIGRLVHSMVFQPELVESSYHRLETKTVTPKGREAAAGLKRDAVSVKDVAVAEKCAEAIKSSPAWLSLRTTDAICERPFTWIDPVSGCPLKAMPDMWLPNLITPTGKVFPLCLDLKTFGDDDLSNDNVKWRIKQFDYHMQAALYLDGIRAAYGVVAKHSFLFVSTKPPYEVISYEVPAGEPDELGNQDPREYTLFKGRNKYQLVCLDLMRRRREGDWQRSDKIINELN